METVEITYSEKEYCNICEREETYLVWGFITEEEINELTFNDSIGG